MTDLVYYEHDALSVQNTLRQCKPLQPPSAGSAGLGALRESAAKRAELITQKIPQSSTMILSDSGPLGYYRLRFPSRTIGHSRARLQPSGNCSCSHPLPQREAVIGNLNTGDENDLKFEFELNKSKMLNANDCGIQCITTHSEDRDGCRALSCGDRDGCGRCPSTPRCGTCCRRFRRAFAE